MEPACGSSSILGCRGARLAAWRRPPATHRTPAGRLQAREIQTRSALAVTFYRPAATAERYKGAWAAQKTPYLTIRGQLPREKSVKIEYQPAHMTNVLGAEG